MGGSTGDPLGKSLWAPWKETSPSLCSVLGSLCVGDAQSGKGLLLTGGKCKQLDPFKVQTVLGHVTFRKEDALCPEDAYHGKFLTD